MKKYMFFSVLCIGFVMSLATGCGSQKSDINQSLLPLMTRRVSGYVYDPAKPVEASHIESVLKAAQLTPSSYNDQPWFFIVCDKNKNPQAYEKVFSSLVEFNQNWAQHAPVLVIVLAHTNSHEGESNRWAQYDTGAAAYGMMLQATALGLMAHQMGGFDENKIKELFKVPEDVVPMAVMALGYSKEDLSRKKKERKPIGENFFQGAWGSGF